MAKSSKIVKVEQTGSASRRHHSQRETLIGLGLNRIGRVSELPDNPSTRGMIAKVAHLVRVMEGEAKEYRHARACPGHPRRLSREARRGWPGAAPAWRGGR